MTHRTFHTIRSTPLILVLASFAYGQEPARPDTSMVFAPVQATLVAKPVFDLRMTAWGFDLLLSESGFGLGGFYRREITDVLAGTITFAISDVKDDGEMEYYDYWTGTSNVPGKKNRLLMLPLMASIQYRLFHNDIVDNFRPYLTAGAGPTMLFVSPYARIIDDGSGLFRSEKVDFFESLKYGKAHTTLGGFIGAGAYFGKDRSNVMGLSIRYYFIPVPSGIEVMQGGFVKEFGGVFITLHFGSAS